jgi:hypothetical protein
MVGGFGPDHDSEFLHPKAYRMKGRVPGMPFQNDPHSAGLVLLVLLVISCAGCGRATPARPQVAPARPRGPKLTEIVGVVADPHHSGEMEFSPDGKTLALSRWDSVELCDLMTGSSTTLTDLQADATRARPRKVAYSKSGRSLAVDYYKRGITLWDIPTGKKQGAIPLEEQAEVMDMVFTDGDRTLVAGVIRATDARTGSRRWECVAMSWEIPSGKPRWSVNFGHELLFEFLSPDGRYAVLRMTSLEWGVFDLATRAKLFGLGGPASSVFLADSSAVVSFRGTRLSLLDVPSGRVRRYLEIAPIAPDRRQLAISSDGKLLAVPGSPEARLASLIGLGSGELLATVECGSPLMICETIRFSPDGRTLATDTYAVDRNDQPVQPLLKLWRVPAVW